ncbi:hypothetical protein [Chitinophaga sp. CF418]|uniref:hypothetical protein n=1 Tax=Chitinophaga sp. CF418 TaxID=1855287 RepID=UPI000922E6D0|nr:hypothetical protein [Chitinophaga sp. CF418]SHM84010.1 hypothetical protein SAMN05216311_103426 [Chitinophaga sp. CF418]
MAEQNSGNKNFNKEELPIPIPPADQAWQSMRQKLDAELPVEGNLPARAPVRYLWIKGVFVIAVVATISSILWQYSRKDNEPLSSPGNNVHDTSLAYIQSVSPASDSHTLTISKQQDTAFQHATSSAVSDVVSNVTLSASSQRDSQSSQTPGSLQSSTTLQHSTSSASLQPSLISDRQYPVVGKTTTKAAPEQSATDKQPLVPLATDEHSLTEQKTIAKQQVTDKLLSKPLASRKRRPGKAAPLSEPPAIQQQQSPASAYTNNDRHHVGKTESHPHLQLSFIQSPNTAYNTSLQHKADPLALRQAGSKLTEKRWALYVQLNVALPLYDSSSYFMGPNGKDQFYRNLIPAVRVERKLWKGTLSLDVQPLVSATPKSNKHRLDVDTQLSPYDTIRTLLKQFGWGVALQYQIPVHQKWQLGAGIQASFLQKAVIRQTIMDTMRIVQTSVSPASAADKRDLSKVRINGMVELDYMAGKWQFGLRALVPLTRISKTKDIPAGPVNGELVVRRRLWKL